MQKLLAAPLSLALAACATQGPPVPVEVKVPTPVPCVALAPAPPAYAFDGATLDQALDEQVRRLLADRLQRRATEAELRALLEACRGQG